MEHFSRNGHIFQIRAKRQLAIAKSGKMFEDLCLDKEKLI